MSKFMKVLNEMEVKQKKVSNALDVVLAQYETKTEKVNYEDTGWSDADTELWNYLCGSGDVQHIYNYWDLIDNGRK